MRPFIFKYKDIDISKINRNLPSIYLAIFVLLLFCRIAPGEDYFGAYKLIVLEPEKYSNTYGIFSPAWLATIMSPFETMPGRNGLYVFTAVTIASIYFAARVFNGSTIPALLSAQLFWVLWWGQVDGLVVLGIALGWLALIKRSTALLVCGIMLALVKPQIGLIPIIAFLWWAEPGIRWKTIAISVALGCLSIFIWGWWPFWIFQNIIGLVKSEIFGPWNISIGLYAIPLFIPAVMLPLKRNERLLALTATALLVSPYLPYYSSLILLCMGIPWWAYIFAFTGFLPNLVGTFWAWRIILLLPVLVLGNLYLPFFMEWISLVKSKLTEKKP